MILLLSLQDRPVGPLAEEGIMQPLTFLFYARGAAELVAESAHLGDLIRIIIGHNLMIVSPPFLLTMHPQQSLSLRQARRYLLWPPYPKIISE